MRHEVFGLLRNGTDSHLNLHQDDAIHSASGYADTRALLCIDFDQASSNRVATLWPMMRSRSAEVSEISGEPCDAGSQSRRIAKFDVTIDSIGQAHPLERGRLEAWDIHGTHRSPLAVLRVVHHLQSRPTRFAAIRHAPGR